MANTPIATMCVDSVVAAIDTIKDLKGKVWYVFSDEELMEKTKGLQYSCVAVIYGGLQGDPESKGKSAKIIIDVILFFKQNAQMKDDPKDRAVAYLDEIRNKFIAQRSPSQHFWEFRSEGAIELKTGVVGYLQRWAAPVMMV